jgi:hypothetical protein
MKQAPVFAWLVVLIADAGLLAWGAYLTFPSITHSVRLAKRQYLSRF